MQHTYFNDDEVMTGLLHQQRRSFVCCESNFIIQGACQSQTAYLRPYFSHSSVRSRHDMSGFDGSGGPLPYAVVDCATTFHVYFSVQRLCSPQMIHDGQ